MEEFYRNWFKKDSERRNRRARKDVATVGGADTVSSSTSSDSNRDRSADMGAHPGASTSSSSVIVPQEPSQIVYENDFLRLKVEKKSFKKQKFFRLQDHLFNFKVEAKKSHESLPLLSDIFDFLHAALTHVLESIKTFYKPDDHNIAYLTLHQEPMVNGLNTGDD